MEKKINIAELLKNCPKGMELYSPIYGVGVLTKVTNRIHVKFPKEHNVKCFRLDGKVSEDGEIMLYPKGKTTWEGFEPPCKFKDGDIIFTHANCLKVGLGNTWISIYQEKRNGGVATYVDYAVCGNRSNYYSNIDGDKPLLCMEKDILHQRLATEEEKQKLFDAIKANGHKWNAETKTLEKLPKFKVGDVIVDIYKKHLHCDSGSGKISQITDDKYIFDDGSYIHIQRQDNWELVPDKFDITTLKPFDKVLVRDKNTDTWEAHLFSRYYRNSDRPYICIGCEGINEYKQCIPYNGNEHLLGTTNDCIDYYKTW